MSDDDIEQIEITGDERQMLCTDIVVRFGRYESKITELIDDIREKTGEPGDDNEKYFANLYKKIAKLLREEAGDNILDVNYNAEVLIRLLLLAKVQSQCAKQVAQHALDLIPLDGKPTDAVQMFRRQRKTQ